MARNNFGRRGCRGGDDCREGHGRRNLHGGRLLRNRGNRALGHFRTDLPRAEPAAKNADNQCGRDDRGSHGRGTAAARALCVRGTCHLLCGRVTKQDDVREIRGRDPHLRLSPLGKGAIQQHGIEPRRPAARASNGVIAQRRRVDRPVRFDGLEQQVIKLGAIDTRHWVQLRVAEVAPPAPAAHDEATSSQYLRGSASRPRFRAA